MRHPGSTLAFVLGVLLVVAAVLGMPSFLVVGIIMVLGASAYRSAKKRYLGDARSGLRISFELLAIIISMVLIFIQIDLLHLVKNGPFFYAAVQLYLVVPLWVLIAYMYISIFVYKRKKT